jgi:hypothetical protein
MSDGCQDPLQQALFEVVQAHRHPYRNVDSFRIVGDPIQVVVVLFGPEGFERSVSRLLTGFGVVEAQDEFPEEVDISQGYSIVLPNGRPPARSCDFGYRIRKITRPSSVHQWQPQYRRCNIVLQIRVETNRSPSLFGGRAGLGPVGPAE